jgi:hypothetical protein
MLKNYVAVAFRNLWKHRTFSAINFLGLSAGMTVCFLIFSYTRFESGYDAFHHNADRIYRVVCDIKTPPANGLNHYRTSSNVPFFSITPPTDVVIAITYT